MIKRMVSLFLVVSVMILLLLGCGKVGEEVKVSGSFNKEGLNIFRTEELAVEDVNRKIIVFKESVSKEKKQKIMAKHNLQIMKDLSLINAVVARVPEQAREKVLAALSKGAEIERIDDDIIVSVIKKPSNPGGGNGGGKPKGEQPPQVLPWGVDRIDADLVIEEGSGIKVAVVDTGIDYRHGDLAANVVGGVNILSTRKDYRDDNGHGTHCAGIIAAVDNEIGVIGVGSQISLYGVKVLDRKGNGYLSDLIAGLEWCVANDIDVINMSLSADVDVQSFHDAISLVDAAGIVQVAAAGNDGSTVDYPARYAETIAVSATDINDNFAYFSNYGPEIDVAAPGVEIYSTYKDDGYATASGTSMSAPHVAGACALKLAVSGGLSPDEVKNSLKATAESIGLSSDLQGAGLVDVESLILN